MKKTWSIYTIKEKALKTGRAVFSTKELSNLTSTKVANANVYSTRLVKKGLAKKLIKGKISFDDDEFVIATQLLEPSYITGLTALNLLGLIQQVPVKIECATSKRSIKYETLGITYHKIPCQLFYGYKKQKKSQSYVLIAEPEKAIIDGIYLNILTKDILKELDEKIDKEKLIEYAKRFKGRGKKKIMKAIK